MVVSAESRTHDGWMLTVAFSSQNLETVNTFIGVTSSFASAIAPAAAAIGLSAMFIKWVTGMYQATCV
jgi:hypothetical protein